MRRRCPFRPCVQSLEDRTVLSFSISSIWHSFLGVVDNKPTTKHPSAATIAAEKIAAQTAKSAHIAQVAHHQAIVAAHRAQHALAMEALKKK